MVPFHWETQLREVFGEAKWKLMTWNWKEAGRRIYLSVPAHLLLSFIDQSLPLALWITYFVP